MERRSLQTSTRLAGCGLWPGLAQVCRLERTTQRKGHCTVEVAYAISSVSRTQADATQLLTWWRGHWSIENRLHWTRDVQFGEDKCRVRTGHAPHVLAVIRNAALNLSRALGERCLATALRQNAFRVDRLLAKLGILKL